VTRTIAEATAAAKARAAAQLQAQLSLHDAERLAPPEPSCTLVQSARVVCHLVVEARESIIAFAPYARDNGGADAADLEGGSMPQKS
ncbi:MAG TPA: hypothetical protein VFK80_11730, partial [Limnochordia bacterium]|nr:hypothetical protein [Limnochordia bacterium]